MKPAKIGYSVAEACSAIPCGRTFLYELIADGRLDARKLGSKTIIPGDSVARLIESLPDAGLAKPARDEPATAA
jgi:excisionase family DNA binding protein